MTNNFEGKSDADLYALLQYCDKMGYGGGIVLDISREFERRLSELHDQIYNGKDYGKRCIQCHEPLAVTANCDRNNCPRKCDNRRFDEMKKIKQ